MGKNVIIAGGSGLVGKNLTKLLIEKGYNVAWFSRNPKFNGEVDQYKLDYKTGTIDTTPLENASFVVNLAGAPISGKRWTKSYKKEILNSRVETTKVLLGAVSRATNKPTTYVQASAVGYYGNQESEKTFTEENEPGKDFLAKVCQEWEKAGNEFPEAPIRRVFLRIGVVFSPGSQAFDKLVLPIKYNLGAPLGSGKQFFPWIHLDDLTSLFVTAMENGAFSGAYNAIAPQILNNSEATRILAKILDKKLWLPNVPSFALKLAFGEMAQLLLTGNRITAQKAIGEGFEFRYPKLENLVNRE